MHSEQKGIILTLFYIIIAGSANIVLASYLKLYDQFIITFICFSFTVFYFFIINFHSLFQIYFICKTHYKDFIKLNIYTAINWLSFYFSLSILDPITSITIIHIAGTVLDNRHLIIKNNYIYFYMSAAFLLFTYELVQHQDIYDSYQIFLALLLSHISGYSIFKVALLSKEFNNKELRPSQVMLIRFFILILICLVQIKWTEFISVHLKIIDVLNIILIGFLSIILPIYLLQKAYSFAKTSNILLTLSFAPIFIFFYNFLIQV